MKEKITIRLLEFNDSQQVIDLGRIIHKESHYNFLPYEEMKIQELIMVTLKNPQSNVCFVAEYDGKIIGALCGFIAAYIMNYELFAQDLGLWILPKKRGTWAAKKLLDTFEYWAKQKGCKEIMLSITSNINSDRTAQFYEKLGYTNLGAICRKRIGGK